MGIPNGKHFILSSLLRMFDVLIKKSSWELLLAFPMWEVGNLGQKMRGLVGETGI